MKSPIRQKGAALVVGMIMLIVMTLLGITSMSTSRTELKIASNLQSHNTGFQSASSILTYAVLEADLAAIPPVDPGIDWMETVKVQTVMLFNDAALTNGTATATVAYMDCKNSPMGFSLTGAGFKGLVHEVTATGKTIKGGATSVQAMGVQTIRPGCP